MSVDYKVLTAAVIYGQLAGNGGIAAAIPAPAGEGGGVRVYTSVAPETVATPFVTQDLAGDGGTALPIGAPASQVVLPWAVTIWTANNYLDDVGDLSELILDALIGSDMRGQSIDIERSDGVKCSVAIQYVGPVIVPFAVEYAATYANTSHRFSITVQRNA